MSDNDGSTVVFLCHSSQDSEFVCQVANYLKRHKDKDGGFLEVFSYEEYQTASESFVRTYSSYLDMSSVFIIFIGANFAGSEHQKYEVGRIVDRLPSNEISVINVVLDSELGRNGWPPEYPDGIKVLPRLNPRDLIVNDGGSLSPARCSRSVIERLRFAWDAPDRLPVNPHLFSYEKNIIDFFRRKNEIGERLFQSGNDDKEEACFQHMRNKLLEGCPTEWPSVKDLSEDYKDRLRNNNLLAQDIGAYRNRGAKVAAAGLRGFETSKNRLNFPEAGPREKLLFPLQEGQLKVGILVSGGIAPGINAVIDGIVERHWHYASREPAHEVQVIGYKNGYHAFIEGAEPTVSLYPRNQGNAQSICIYTSDHANEGGSILGTYRWEKLIDLDSRTDSLRQIVTRLCLDKIDILYMIGGDGTMKAAHALWNVSQEQYLSGELKKQYNRRYPISIVAIPKTMDNDILWMWQSFGFMSAVEKSREVLEQLHTEVSSNPRLCVLQLFGSDSGFVVSHTVLASAAGQCELALIPEAPFSILGIAKYLKRKIQDEKRDIPRALVVMAETAIPVDVEWYIGDKSVDDLPDYLEPDDLLAMRALLNKLEDENKRKKNYTDNEYLELSDAEREAIRDNLRRLRSGERIEGQTSDNLRRAGLKIVMQALEKLLPLPELRVHSENPRQPDWSKLRMLANEPRHLVRAIPPSTTDIIMGQRLGTLAVDNAMAGYTDFMISQWLTEFVLVPLDLVVLGRKRIPQSGIFWKSVLAKTGQPDNLVKPWRFPVNEDNSDPCRSHF